jgi:hypothetical protein
VEPRPDPGRRFRVGIGRKTGARFLKNTY